MVTQKKIINAVEFDCFSNIQEFQLLFHRTGRKQR